MKFSVVGPIRISRHGNKRLISKQSLADLKEELERLEEGLSDACGCYVFAKKNSRGMLPWYVGQACRSSLAGEALNPDNREKYNGVLDSRGTPVLFLLPLRTPTGKFR